jgi:hypothetical protein
MTSINSSSIQLIAALLDGTTTVMPTPGEAVTVPVQEAFGGLPQRIPGGTSLQNIKLGTLNRVKWIAVYGDVGIKFRTTETGSDIQAHPFAFLANNVTAGIGISEVWVSNDDNEEHTVTILAAE